MFAYVVMPNPMHMIAGVDGDLHAVVRDFKRFTSRAIHESLSEDSRSVILRWLEESTRRQRISADELGLWQDGFIRSRSCRRLFSTRSSGICTTIPCARVWLSLPRSGGTVRSARNYAGMQDVCMAVDAMEF